MLLELKGLAKRFGGLMAVNDISFHVREGEILGLIGPNGSGKTTVFNLICGVYKPSGGVVTSRGKKITGLKPHGVAERGIIRTFQSEALLEEMTVFQNMMLACHLTARPKFLPALFSTYNHRKKEADSEERVLSLLDLVGLLSSKDNIVNNMPHGHKRTLGVAMALAANPVLLLLDEPVTGMNAEETINMMNLIRKVRDSGVTILLVEHDMRMVMGVSDRVIAINYGQKIAEGSPNEIRDNGAVIEAYLGTSYTS